MSDPKTWSAAGKPVEEKPLEEWAAEACDNGKGIRCPKCNCGHWRVYYTRDGNGIIKRKRTCRHCGHAIMTHEKPLGNSSL